MCYVVGPGTGYLQPSLVLGTVDAGITWSVLLTGTEHALSGLVCPDSNTCYGLGQRLLKTDDGGRTWSSHELPGSPSGLVSLECLDQATCYAISSRFGAQSILRTGDGGVTWSSVYTETEKMLGALECPIDGSTCYALATEMSFAEETVVFTSTLVTTTDGGDTWASTFAANEMLTQILCPVDSDTCFAIAGDVAPPLTSGSVLRTSDGGQSWSVVASGLRNVVGGLHCVDKQTCYLPAGYGTILKTTDGGARWSTQFVGDTPEIMSITCNQTTCYAAGTGGTILKTTNGGEVDTAPSRAEPLVFASTPTLTPTPEPTPPPHELVAFELGGGQPSVMLFDGESIWVASMMENSVKKLGLDGTILGRFVVINPSGLAFDGENVWATLGGIAGRVTKLGLDGSDFGTFMTGDSARGALFDGEHIWVANLDDPSVTKLALDGTIIGTYTGGAEPGSLPYETLAFDGDNIWLASSYYDEDSVTKLSRQGDVLGVFHVGHGSHDGITFDGEYIWVTNLQESVTKVALDGSEVGTFPVLGYPNAILFAAGHIWVAAEDLVTQLDLDGSMVGRYSVKGYSKALAFDGESIWIAASASWDRPSMVSRLTLGQTPASRQKPRPTPTIIIIFVPSPTPTPTLVRLRDPTVTPTTGRAP